jgi:chromosome partitioning protein
MATTIAVLSQKGGTGKTTTVRTLADVFGRVGLEVLAVDLDPQGNLSDYFDVPADADPTIADVLAGQAKATEAIHNDVLPANLGLAESELILSGKMGREMTLRRALRDVKRRYDVILVDCPPALGLLTVNAVVAADYALLSTEAQYFSLQGVEQALEVIELAKDNLHPDLEWLGVVMNIADMRTIHSREALAQLKDRFGDKLFGTPIRGGARADRDERRARPRGRAARGARSGLAPGFRFQQADGGEDGERCHQHGAADTPLADRLDREDLAVGEVHAEAEPR